MFRKIQILIIILFIILQVIYSGEKKGKKIKKKKKDLENFTNIFFDEVIFDEDDFMKIIDNNGNTIINYEWYENKKSQNIRNAKIYNENKELIMTLVYMDQESGAYQIHFKDNEEKRGVINIMRDPGSLVTYNFKVNYFIEGFDLRFYIDNDDTTTKVGKLYYNNDLVMFYKKVINKMEFQENSDLYVEKNFLENNKIDTGFWALIFRIII